MRLGEKTKADALKETVQLELLDSFSKAYDSIFYYAIDSHKVLSEKQREIEAIGYRNLANLLGLNV
jgi:hypothetical protein